MSDLFISAACSSPVLWRFQSWSCLYSVDNFSVISGCLLLFWQLSLFLMLHADILYHIFSFIEDPLLFPDSSSSDVALSLSLQLFFSYLLLYSRLIRDSSTSPASSFNLLTAPLLTVLTVASKQPNTAKFLFHQHVNSFSLSIICQNLSGNGDSSYSLSWN